MVYDLGDRWSRTGWHATYQGATTTFTTHQAMFVNLERGKLSSPDTDCPWLTLKRRLIFRPLPSYMSRHVRFRRIDTVARFMTLHSGRVSLWIQNCLQHDLYITVTSLMTCTSRSRLSRPVHHGHLSHDLYITVTSLPSALYLCGYMSCSRNAWWGLGADTIWEYLPKYALYRRDGSRYFSQSNLQMIKSYVYVFVCVRAYVRVCVLDKYAQ